MFLVNPQKDVALLTLVFPLFFVYILYQTEENVFCSSKIVIWKLRFHTRLLIFIYTDTKRGNPVYVFLAENAERLTTLLGQQLLMQSAPATPQSFSAHRRVLLWDLHFCFYLNMLIHLTWLRPVTIKIKPQTQAAMTSVWTSVFYLSFEISKWRIQ